MVEVKRETFCGIGADGKQGLSRCRRIIGSKGELPFHHDGSESRVLSDGLPNRVAMENVDHQDQWVQKGYLETLDGMVNRV